MQEGKIVFANPAFSQLTGKGIPEVVGVVWQGELRPNPDADFVLEPENFIACIGNDRSRDTFFLMASSATGSQ
jgi:CPA2 family monovalent cation:H+ antiporter-2